MTSFNASGVTIRQIEAQGNSGMLQKMISRFFHTPVTVSDELLVSITKRRIMALSNGFSAYPTCQVRFNMRGGRREAECKSLQINYPKINARISSLQNAELQGLTLNEWKQIFTEKEFIPVSFEDWVIFAKMQQINEDGSSDISSLQAIAQIEEEHARNDISTEDAILLLRQISEGSNLTKDEIEDIGARDDRDLLQIIENIHILLDKQDVLIDRANLLIDDIISGELIGIIVVGDNRNQHQIALDQLSNIVTSSLPRNRINIRNLISNAQQLGIILPSDIISYIDSSEIETANMINKAASIIDGIPSLDPDIRDDDTGDGETINDVVNDLVPSSTAGVILLLAPLLFAEKNTKCCNKNLNKNNIVNGMSDIVW